MLINPDICETIIDVFFMVYYLASTIGVVVMIVKMTSVEVYLMTVHLEIDTQCYLKPLIVFCFVIMFGKYNV